MPESWEGVLILLAVTVITVLADFARRWMGPPRDPSNYVPPTYPDPDKYVPTLETAESVPQARKPAEDDEPEWDEGGGQEDEGA